MSLFQGDNSQTLQHQHCAFPSYINIVVMRLPTCWINDYLRCTVTLDFFLIAL